MGHSGRFRRTRECSTFLVYVSNLRSPDQPLSLDSSELPSGKTKCPHSRSHLVQHPSASRLQQHTVDTDTICNNTTRQQAEHKTTPPDYLALKQHNNPTQRAETTRDNITQHMTNTTHHNTRPHPHTLFHLSVALFTYILSLFMVQCPFIPRALRG